MVNDKGYVFQVSNLNSSPIDVRKISTTKELTAKSDGFALSFMNISDDEYIVLAWTDSKEKGWIKKIPVSSRVSLGLLVYRSLFVACGVNCQMLRLEYRMNQTTLDSSTKHRHLANQKMHSHLQTSQLS